MNTKSWPIWTLPIYYRAFLVVQLVKNPPAMRETWVWSLGWEDPLEKGKATHSSILAWRSPWTEEPGRLQSMGLQSDMTQWLSFSHKSCLSGSSLNVFSRSFHPSFHQYQQCAQRYKSHGTTVKRHIGPNVTSFIRAFYNWASLVTQLVKNPLAMWESWI